MTPFFLGWEEKQLEQLFVALHFPSAPRFQPIYSGFYRQGNDTSCSFLMSIRALLKRIWNIALPGECCLFNLQYLGEYLTFQGHTGPVQKEVIPPQLCLLRNFQRKKINLWPFINPDFSKCWLLWQPLKGRESQNQGIIEVGKDLQDHQIQPATGNPHAHRSLSANATLSHF